MFGEWGQDTYGRLIAEFTNMPLHVVAPGNGNVMTWLEDMNAPAFIDVRALPWPPV